MWEEAMLIQTSDSQNGPDGLRGPRETQWGSSLAEIKGVHEFWEYRMNVAAGGLPKPVKF